jgi:hypothetical protein
MITIGLVGEMRDLGAADLQPVGGRRAAYLRNFRKDEARF